MKKYFTSTNYKKRQKILNSYHENIVIKKYQKKNYSERIKRDNNIVHDKKLNREVIKAPENFSMIYNIDIMLNFFNSLFLCLKENKYDVFINMKELTLITPDALLYLLSFLDYFKIKNIFKHNLGGNLPENEKCAQLIIESGFPNYVKMIQKPEYKSKDFLKIEKNSIVKSDIADKVLKFAEEKINYSNRDVSESIYVTIVECMTNTKQHAYNNVGNWWLIAQYNAEVNKIQFCFLDNGQGIPKSVKMTFRERFLELLPITNNQHSKLIFSTLNGEFRTKTGFSYRGKGLPKIKQYSDEKFVDDLVIISNKGYVNLNNNELKELEHKFYGTLLSWNFIKKQI